MVQVMPHSSFRGCARRRAGSRVGGSVITLVSAGWLLAACSPAPRPGPTDTTEPATVLVKPATIQLEAGHEVWLAAQADDRSGRPIGGAPFQFSVTAPQVLHVSARGHVTSLGPASAQAAVIVASGTQTRRVPVVVLPGPPQRLRKMSGDGQQVRAGDAPPTPLAVQIADQWNNPLADVPFEFESTPKLFAPQTVRSNAQGVASVRLPALLRAGEFEWVARSGGAQHLSAAFDIRVTPGPPAAIESVAEPAALGASVASAATDPETAKSAARVALLVTDAHGNPVPHAELTARVAKGLEEPLKAVTDAAGQATLTLPSSTRRRVLDVEVAASAAAPLRRTLSLAPDAHEAPKAPSRRAKPGRRQ